MEFHAKCSGVKHNTPKLVNHGNLKFPGHNKNSVFVCRKFFGIFLHRKSSDFRVYQSASRDINHENRKIFMESE